MDTLLAWAPRAGLGHLRGRVDNHGMGATLRPADDAPSQVSIVCKRSGSRYRWVGLGALVAIGLTGALMVARLDSGTLLTRSGRPDLALSDAYGQTLAVLSILWGLLVVASASMAFWLHPRKPAAPAPICRRKRSRRSGSGVGRAIARMDRVLKFELAASVVSIALGASLGAGGLL